MTQPHVVKCLICARSFLWAPHKLVCSEACRREKSLKKKAASQEHLTDLPLASLPRVIDRELEELTDPIQLLIRCNAPPNAVAFRLGCFSSMRKRGRYLTLRWFPFYPYRSPPVYSLKPWEPPRLPCPGYYVVAYFDAKNNLIGEPEFNVRIPDPVVDFVWSRGDANLLVKSQKSPTKKLHGSSILLG